MFRKSVKLACSANLVLIGPADLVAARQPQKQGFLFGSKCKEHRTNEAHQIAPVNETVSPLHGLNRSS